MDGAKRSAFYYSASLLALFAAKFGTGGLCAIPDYIFEGMAAYLFLILLPFDGDGSFLPLSGLVGLFII